MFMKIEKNNEFTINVDIMKLIEEAENTSSSDLEYISKRESYKNVVKLGEKVIPFLLERIFKSIIKESETQLYKSKT